MSRGLLVMAYGTPRDRDDVARYYTDIRGGRPPAPAALAELVARYDAIGGTFPLRAITGAQVDALRAELGPGWMVELGQKHAGPTIEEGRAALAAAGAVDPVGLVLAPHYSAVSVGRYAERAGLDTVASWHLLPAYVDFLAGAVREAAAGLPGAEVVFTAHSIPRRVVAAGDPYPDQVAATAAAVAARAGLDRWSVAYQSAGRTPEPWLGPDVREVVRSGTAAGVVVCPCGFTGDHLEVVYDLDVEAATVARESGVPFARTRTVGADPAVMAALADLVRIR